MVLDTKAVFLSVVCIISFQLLEMHNCDLTRKTLSTVYVHGMPIPYPQLNKLDSRVSKSPILGPDILRT